MLAIPAQSEHRFAVHQPKIRTALLNLHICKRVEETIVVFRRQPLKERNALRREAHGLNDLEALFPLFEQCRQKFRRVLHIAVHCNDRIAVCVVNPAGQRQLMSEVAREKDGLNMRVRRTQRAQDFSAAVARPVVDEKELIVIGQLRHHRSHALHEMRNIILFVINRNDNGNPLHDARLTPLAKNSRSAAATRHFYRRGLQC